MTSRALKTEVLKSGMSVGLFGGSFDPPHIGHLHVAQTAMKRLRLDRVWWLVSPQNPLKTHAPADAARRIGAIEALAHQPRMVVSTIEERLGINRTIDLIDHLTYHHPDVNFVWIMGSDNLGGFHRWERWRDLATAMPICVIARPGQAIKARLSRTATFLRHARLHENQAHILKKIKAPVWTYLTEPLHPVSSSALRAQGLRA
ncbi:nicotinate-nucleotide adenylyltransferase [Woodsholea maritima]|uniref:nicotinate-nucleotide adenylyltransferase n=1 Tax=Woodsholea maritima TaxID=240237 RepID=UPI000371CEAC|nr:nicotinate-nucleotide adenylyltransferase [Woodsholea maritima]